MSAFNTPFKHRVNACQNGEFLNPIDAINPSLERAAALADMIEVACEVTDTTSFDPNTLWRTAQAVRLEILDAQALLNAYFDAEKAKKQELQP